MVKMQIKLDKVYKELFRREDVLELEAIGSVHKEGTLLGNDRIEAEIILKGQGVRDIVQHFPKKGGLLGGSHIISRGVEIVISD